MLIAGSQRRCLGMPSWESCSMSSVVQHLIALAIAQHHQTYSLHAARNEHTAHLWSAISRRATTCSSIKEGYNCETYIRQCHNRHLRRILAHSHTGPHWLPIETGRRKKLDKNDRTCPICVDKCVNPDLPEQHLAALTPMRRLLILLQMSIKSSLTALSTRMPESKFQIFSTALLIR